MSDDRPLLYRRVQHGKRISYVPVCEDGQWMPTPGLWLVEKKPGSTTRQLILTQERLADLPDPLPAAALDRHRDAICQVIAGCMTRWSEGRGMSAMDFWNAILQVFAAAEAGR